MTTKSNIRILLDLDDVLCDFIGTAASLWGVKRKKLERYWTPGDWSMVSALGKARYGDSKPEGISDEEFWRMIHSYGSRFWENLPLLPWMWKLIQLVEQYTLDWHIISAPSRCSTSYTGKVRWIKRWLGEDFDRFALTPHKHIFACPNVVLIDDRESNVEHFIQHGGKGVIFPRYNNRLHAQREDPLGYVTYCLKELYSDGNSSQHDRNASVCHVQGRVHHES